MTNLNLTADFIISVPLGGYASVNIDALCSNWRSTWRVIHDSKSENPVNKFRLYYSIGYISITEKDAELIISKNSLIMVTDSVTQKDTYCTREYITSSIQILSDSQASIELKLINLKEQIKGLNKALTN